ETPVAAEPVAAIGRRNFTDRRIGAEQQRVRIGPEFFLRRFREHRRQPLMHDGKAEHPAGRAAGRADWRRDPDQHVEAIFVTAVNRRRHDLEQPGVAQPGHRLGRNLPVAFRLLGLRTDEWRDRGRPRDQVGYRRTGCAGFDADHGHSVASSDWRRFLRLASLPQILWAQPSRSAGSREDGKVSLAIPFWYRYPAGMKLTQLSYVAAIAEQGSLRAAARHLGVAQPAFSRSIAELERELGARLFERRARSMIATPLGEAFVRRASAILNDVRRARDEVEQL